MDLQIEGQSRHFVPLKTFCEYQQLPPTFSIALFEPKDATGLGRINTASAGELNLVRQVLLDAIPTAMPLHGWLAFLPDLARLLDNKLHEINPEIGLKTIEIDYAVAGFFDVCQNLVYSMIRARASNEPLPTFQTVYSDWLNASVRIASAVHTYIHQGEIWAIQIVHTAYGRAGLIIWTERETHYVLDNHLGCPADGFMLALMHEVAARILTAASAPAQVAV
jgi:hypothetical protein